MATIQQLEARVNQLYQIYQQKEAEFAEASAQMTESEKNLELWADYANKLYAEVQNSSGATVSSDEITRKRRDIEAKVEEFKKRRQQALFYGLSGNDLEARLIKVRAILAKNNAEAKEMKKQRDDLSDQCKGLINEMMAAKKEIEPIIEQTAANSIRVRNENRLKNGELCDLRIKAIQDRIDFLSKYFSSHSRTLNASMEAISAKSELQATSEMLKANTIMTRLLSDRPPPPEAITEQKAVIDGLFNLPQNFESLITSAEQETAALQADCKKMVQAIKQHLEAFSNLRNISQQVLSEHSKVSHDISMITFKHERLQKDNKRLAQQFQQVNQEKRAAKIEEINEVISETEDIRKTTADLTAFAKMPVEQRQNVGNTAPLEAELSTIYQQLKRSKIQRENVSKQILDKIKLFSQKNASQNGNLQLSSKTVLGQNYQQLTQLNEQVSEQAKRHEYNDFYSKALNIQSEYIESILQDKNLSQTNPCLNPEFITVMSMEGTFLENENGYEVLIDAPKPVWCDALFHPSNVDELFPVVLLMVSEITPNFDINTHLKSMLLYIEGGIQGNTKPDFTLRQTNEFVCGFYPNPSFVNLSPSDATTRLIKYVESWLLYDSDSLKNSAVISDLMDFFRKNASLSPSAGSIIQKLQRISTIQEVRCSEDKIKKVKADQLPCCLPVEKYVSHMNFIIMQVYMHLTASGLINSAFQKMDCTEVITLRNLNDNIIWSVRSAIAVPIAKRDKIVDWWVQAAKTAYTTKNFFLFFAIMIGMTEGPIERAVLSKTSMREDLKNLRAKIANREATVREISQMTGFMIPPLIEYFDKMPSVISRDTSRTRDMAKFFMSVFNGRAQCPQFCVNFQLADDLRAFNPQYRSYENFPSLD